MGAKTIGSWLGHAGVMDVIPHAGRSWSNFETIEGGPSNFARETFSSPNQFPPKAEFGYFWQNFPHRAVRTLAAKIRV